MIRDLSGDIARCTAIGAAVGSFRSDALAQDADASALLAQATAVRAQATATQGKLTAATPAQDTAQRAFNAYLAASDSIAIMLAAGVDETTINSVVNRMLAAADADLAAAEALIASL